MTMPEVPELPIMMAVSAALKAMSMRGGELATDQSDAVAAVRSRAFVEGALATILVQLTGRLENDLRATRVLAGLPVDTPLESQGDPIMLAEIDRPRIPAPAAGLPITTRYMEQMQSVVSDDGETDIASLISTLITSVGSALSMLEARVAGLAAATGTLLPEVESE